MNQVNPFKKTKNGISSCSSCLLFSSEKQIRVVFIALFLGLIIHQHALSQTSEIFDNRHFVYGEVLGATFGLSFNYEFLYNNQFGTRIGIGSLWANDDFLGEGYRNCEQVDFRTEERFDEDPDLVSSSTCSPALFATLNYLSHLYYDDMMRVDLEFNAGPAFYLLRSDLKTFLTFNIGVRLDYDGLIVRAGYNPLFNYDDIFHSFGVSIGVSISRANRILSNF